jgi:hypothetical protein
MTAEKEDELTSIREGAIEATAAIERGDEQGLYLWSGSIVLRSNVITAPTEGVADLARVCYSAG